MTSTSIISITYDGPHINLSSTEMGYSQTFRNVAVGNYNDANSAINIASNDSCVHDCMHGFEIESKIQKTPVNDND